jgi:hypothetical protein
MEKVSRLADKAECWRVNRNPNPNPNPKADTLKQLRPIGKGDQELEKRLD